MKTNNLFKSILMLAVAGTMTACDENAWNDHLDGFEDKNDEPISVNKAIDYTLTDADYVAIAGNSSNVAMAGNELKAALAAVGTQHAFSAEIPAAQYVPAFLGSTSFPYFTLTKGSSVKLTYNVAGDVPAAVKEAPKAELYTITSDEYQQYVWESDDNYIDAFSPSKPASRYLAQILLKSEVDEEVNPYVIVSYNQTEQEPVFGNVSGGEEPGFELSNTIASASLNALIEIDGVVTAICKQGYIISDNSGNILVYMGSAFDASSVQIGNQMHISGTVGSYNKGFQVIGNNADVALEVTVIGQQEVTYPTPVEMTGADFTTQHGRKNDVTATYARFTGVPVISGNYVNFTVEGTDVKGSLYQATPVQIAAFTDGQKATVTGYFMSVNSSKAGDKYCNFIPTMVDGKAVASAPAKSVAKAPVAQVPTTTYNAVYHWDGAKWATLSNFTVLNPDDYYAMGQKYQNLTTPDVYLPTYLAQKYPYAQEGTEINVLYLLYKDSKTAYACDPYVLKNNTWVLNRFVTEETSQFVYTSSGWMYDPNVTITLPAGRNMAISSTYYQACVDWVYNNICVPLGDTSIKSGKFYVTSYGNNEYYCGTSAYQNNIDLRPDKAREQYPAGYTGMSDEEIVALEKSRFLNEVMPGALSTLHPDAKPIEGLEVLFTVNFSVYTGTTTEYTAVFKVVGQGKFEPVSCTWDEE